jgi:hypothetical protein
MNTPNATELLEERIKLLETEHTESRRAFRKILAETGDSLRPASMIRNMLSHTVSDNEVKAPVLDSAIGLATGFVARKLLLGSVHNPLTRMAANLVQAGISSYVAKHPDAIKNAGAKLMDFIGKKTKGKNEDQQPDNE